MKLNDFAAEFLMVTIPHYASNPDWRKIFEELANLSEEERTGMLQKLNTITGPQLLGLENDEQFPTALMFIRLSLEDPRMPLMMVKMIDYENLRVQKIS